MSFFEVRFRGREVLDVTKVNWLSISKEESRFEAADLDLLKHASNDFRRFSRSTEVSKVVRIATMPKEQQYKNGNWVWLTLFLDPQDQVVGAYVYQTND